MRHFLSTAALCLASAMTCACDGAKGSGGAGSAGAAGGKEPILLGHVASLTGKRATFGTSADRGAQLAVAEVNAKGGVLGRPLVLKTENDQSNDGDPKQAAKKLIHSDHVAVLLGEVTTSASLEMAPVAQDAKVPMISPAATGEKVTQKGDYVFRACFTNGFQGEVASKFALEKGLKTAAILHETTSDYSVSLADAFRKHFAGNGGKIVAERTYASANVDFAGALAAIKAENPDVLFIPGYYGDVPLIAKQARQAGITALLLGGDGWRSTDLIQNGGAAIEGACFADHLVTADFEAKYKAKYGEEADSMAALGYDAAMMAADAIARAGSTDSAKVRDALAQTKAFPGASGVITLDKDRNAVKPAAVMTVKDGKFEVLTVVKP